MTATPLIEEDPAILGGVPCFAGTRVPIAHVLASLNKGLTMERLQASWPFLTQAHIAAARQYSRIRLGLLAGRVTVADDFDGPLPPDVQSSFEK